MKLIFLNHCQDFSVYFTNNNSFSHRAKFMKYSQVRIYVTYRYINKDVLKIIPNVTNNEYKYT